MKASESQQDRTMPPNVSQGHKLGGSILFLYRSLSLQVYEVIGVQPGYSIEKEEVKQYASQTKSYLLF